MRTVAADDGDLITGTYLWTNVGSCAMRWKLRSVAAPIFLPHSRIRPLREPTRQALATSCAPPCREGHSPVRCASAV
jgi:hypothetical protein